MASFKFTVVIVHLVLLSLVASKPLPKQDQISPKACSAVAEVVQVLKLSKATAFCYSFLSIAPVTQTSTSIISVTSTTSETTTVTTSPTITVIETSTQSSTVTQITSTRINTLSTTQVIATTTPVVTITSTSTRRLSTTVTTTSTSYTLPAVRRDASASSNVHDVRKRALPSFIRKFASSAISDACSCLHDPTATTTTTLTTTNTAKTTESLTSTQYTSITTTATATTTVTSTVSTDTQTTLTTTVGSISTTASTSITTVVTTTLVTVTSTKVVTTPYPSQVVQNPSFEQNSGGLFASSAPPWSGFGFQNNPFAIVENTCSSQVCPYDGSALVYYDGDSPGGAVDLTQTLHGVQVGKQYSFSAYVGFRNQGAPSDPTDTTHISVTLDGVTVVPSQIPCPTDAQCPLKNNGQYGYRQITGTVTPTNPDPQLIIRLDLQVPTDRHPQYPLLDDVTLTLS